MGKSHVFNVFDQLLSQLTITEPKVIIGMTTPRTEMDFIDRETGERKSLAFCLAGVFGTTSGNGLTNEAVSGRI